MKDTVFFDLGNVLLFFDTLKMYRQIAEVSGLQLEEVTALVQHHVDPYEKGEINTQKVHEDFSRLSKKELDTHAMRRAMCDIFKPNEAVVTIAQQLKEKGLKLFILSNTCQAHFEYILENYPFLKLFDGFVLSYQVGSRKPEKKIFESALSIAKCKREHCFYTDDIPEFVKAAKAVHIDAENYTTPERLKEALKKRAIL